MNEPLYRKLATIIDAYHRCEKELNPWSTNHKERAERLVLDYMPSGSGIDAGTHLYLSESTGEKLVFGTSFHHMTEGMYDGWTEHNITVRPSLIHGFTLTISGRNRNEIKDYLYEVFAEALSITLDNDGQRVAA